MNGRAAQSVRSGGSAGEGKSAGGSAASSASSIASSVSRRPILESRRTRAGSLPRQDRRNPQRVCDAQQPVADARGAAEEAGLEPGGGVLAFDEAEAAH